MLDNNEVRIVCPTEEVEHYRPQVQGALDFLAKECPQYYKFVTDNLYAVRISKTLPSRFSIIGREFTFNIRSILDKCWVASVLVHEATHSLQHQELRNCPKPCEKDEAEAVEQQREVLQCLGCDSSLHSYLDKALETRWWETPYEEQDW